MYNIYTNVQWNNKQQWETVVNIADLSFQSYLKFLTFIFCPIIVKLKTKLNETKKTLILQRYFTWAYYIGAGLKSKLKLIATTFPYDFFITEQTKVSKVWLVNIFLSSHNRDTVLYRFWYKIYDFCYIVLFTSDFQTKQTVL